MWQFVRPLTAALFLGSLLACAAAPIEYLPISESEGRRFGYKDAVISDGYFKLLVVHPGHDPTTKQAGRAVVEEMWHRRATELCVASAYDFNFYRFEQQTVLYEYYGGRPGAFEIEGTVTCKLDARLTGPQPGKRSSNNEGVNQSIQ